MTTTTAIIITNNGVSSKTFEVGVTHTDIHEMIGNWFDCVRGENIIGYVSDTGLIDGEHINRSGLRQWHAVLGCRLIQR